MSSTTDDHLATAHRMFDLTEPIAAGTYTEPEPTTAVTEPGIGNECSG